MSPRFITTHQETQNKLGNETPEEPEEVEVNRFFFGRRVKRIDAKSDISAPNDALPSGFLQSKATPMRVGTTTSSQNSHVDQQRATAGGVRHDEE